MRRALAAVVAATAVAGGVAAAAPAQARPYSEPSVITSVVYWTGADCISVEYSEGFTTNVAMKCGGYSERTYLAVPGQFVGADPMPLPTDPTTTLGCLLRIDGGVDNTDYAPAGDVHNDVDCLRILVVNEPSHPYPSYPDWPPPPPPPPPLKRAL
jgi:hypothetical protein